MPSAPIRGRPSRSPLPRQWSYPSRRGKRNRRLVPGLGGGRIPVGWGRQLIAGSLLGLSVPSLRHTRRLYILLFRARLGREGGIALLLVTRAAFVQWAHVVRRRLPVSDARARIGHAGWRSRCGGTVAPTFPEPTAEPPLQSRNHTPKYRPGAVKEEAPGRRGVSDEGVAGISNGCGRSVYAQGGTARRGSASQRIGCPGVFLPPLVIGQPG